MPVDCDDISTKLFAKHNLRCTKQRKAIYGALTASRCHPTADELYRAVQGQIPGVSLATVYNTLEAFNDAGLINKLPDAGLNGSARYDAHREPHTHLRDRCTGVVADAPDDISKIIFDHLPQEVLDTIRARTGFSVDEVQVELIGKFDSGSQL